MYWNGLSKITRTPGKEYVNTRDRTKHVRVTWSELRVSRDREGWNMNSAKKAVTRGTREGSPTPLVFRPKPWPAGTRRRDISFDEEKQCRSFVNGSPSPGPLPPCTLPQTSAKVDPPLMPTPLTEIRQLFLTKSVSKSILVFDLYANTSSLRCLYNCYLTVCFSFFNFLDNLCFSHIVQWCIRKSLFLSVMKITELRTSLVLQT